MNRILGIAILAATLLSVTACSAGSSSAVPSGSTATQGGVRASLGGVRASL